MKTFEEYTDSTDVLSSGILPLLEREIRDLMDPLMVGKQLLGEDTSLVGAAGGTKRFRLEKERFVAEDFNESADIPDISVANPDGYEDVTPTYYGGRDPITGQAILDADYNAINRSLRKIARAMAIRGDARIWNEILNAATITAEAIAGGTTEFDLAHGDNSDAGSAILAVTDVTVTNTSTWELDYINGHIKFNVDPGASTIDYIWSDARTYIRAETAGDLDYDDIVNAKIDLRAVYVDGDTIVIDPLTTGVLLKSDKFIDASAFGETVMINGFIGKVAGMPVLMTDTLYDDLMLVIKRGPELGVTLYKETMKTEVEKIHLRPGDVNVKAWEKSLPVVIKPDWIRIVMNGQINAYDE